MIIKGISSKLIKIKIKMKRARISNSPVFAEKLQKKEDFVIKNGYL